MQQALPTSRYARKHRRKPSVLRIPRATSPGGEIVRVSLFTIVLCGCVYIGVAGYRWTDFLLARTQAGLTYCADDPMLAFEQCSQAAEDQIGCKQNALERMREYVPVCFPEAVSGF